MRKILTALTLSLLVFDALACSGSPDAAPPPDASSPDANPLPDASPPPVDAGTDATVNDAGPDAKPERDGGGGEDAGPDAITDVRVSDADAEAGRDCDALIGKMLSAPVLPPNRWIGLDLSNGGTADGGPNAGGLTIDQADILACASSVEPDVFEAGAPITGGARTATFSADAGTVLVNYNLDSRVIFNVQILPPAGSVLTFHSRAGGAYEDGGVDGSAGSANVYAIGFGPGPDGGAGYFTKNGKDFPADWSTSYDDAGAEHASAWINELYDGMMATYAPSAPAVVDCLDTSIIRPNGLDQASGCLVRNLPGGDTAFGVRPLGAYATFSNGTNQPTSMYEVWSGGYPTCATPRAAIELFDYGSIYVNGNGNPVFGPSWIGWTMGTLSAAKPYSNAGGMLFSEANRLMGCGASDIVPRDPGYASKQWGPNGEAELEYNADSGVAYKLFVKKGFHGTLDVVANPGDSGLGNEYNIGPGTLTLNGAPLTLDWTAGDGGTLNAVITDISNAYLAEYCGITDTDCVQAGDCVITPNDGHGHSTFSLVASSTTASSCGGPNPLTFVFAQGGSVPAEVYVTNPGGQ